MNLAPIDPGTVRLSVALCTYNGANYLTDQLDSIFNQTRQPDELILVDDGSSDETVRIAREFQARSPFPFHVHVNQANLRSTKNFERAISLCTGDLIATCDQDDVWLPHKLERHFREMIDRPDALVTFSDAWLVGPHLEETGQRLWPSYYFDERAVAASRETVNPRLLLKSNVVTGTAMVFRRELLPIIMPISAKWIHDAWIGFIAATLGSVVPINEPLLKYRRHEAQQVGATPLTLWRQIRNARQFTAPFFEARAEAFQDLLTRLCGLSLRYPQSVEVAALVDEKLSHTLASARMRRQFRPIRLCQACRELVRGRYHRFGLGWKSFLVDAFYP